jgi:hypothetical protein
MPFRCAYSALRYGARSYDPRLLAVVPLFNNHVLGKGFNTAELPKNDEAVDLVLRAAKNPMALGTGGAAAQLAATKVFDDVVPISGPSAAIELGRLGLRVEFGRYASISVPGRVCDADDCGGFVAEGDPIPVKVISLTGVSLSPSRLPIIAVFSNLVAQTSNCERVIPAVMNEVGLLKLDAELLSTTAASASRPAGLLNGVTPITATAAGSEAMEKDIAALVAALSTAGGGVKVCFIASPPQAATLKLRAGARFDYPILASSALANGSIVAVEAGSFVSGFDPIPEFEITDTTALHMEVDTPLPLATGTGPTVATPIRALWDTNCSAVKMILQCSWAMRATGHVQIINSCNW